jgi:hypothetical protein
MRHDLIKRRDREKNEDNGGSFVQNTLPHGFLQPKRQSPGKKRDQGEDKQRCRDECDSHDEHLYPNRRGAGPLEQKLRKERQKKDLYLGVRDVHQCSAPPGGLRGKG